MKSQAINNNFQTNSKNQFSTLKFGFWVLFVICILEFGISQKVFAATLYTGSATQVVYKGESFVVDWYLDTENVSLNTADLTITYPKDLLQVTDVSTGNSLLSLWILPPEFDNTIGQIKLTGGAPNGFKSSNFPIFRATFNAVNTGNAKISLDSKSMILRNDGLGTSETLKFTAIEFPIVEQSLKPSNISSTTHPDQNKWYKEKRVTIKFETKSATEYSYVFTANSELFPDDSAETQLNEVSYDNLPDGIYYFKLNSKLGPSQWQEAGVYRVQIDSTPPELFPLEIGTDSNIFSGNDFLSFSTVDKTSGISHYNIKFGLFGSWKNAESPYKLHRPIIGDEIKVAAIDTAGNQRIETIEYKGLIPIWLAIALAIILLCVIAYLINRKLKKSKQNNEFDQTPIQ